MGSGGSGFTLLFEVFAKLFIEQEMSVNKVAKMLRITAIRIWCLFTYWIKRAIAKDEVSLVEQIGIDETSLRKVHHYVTVTVDCQARRVIHVGEDKNAEVIGQMKVELQTRGLRAENIKHEEDSILENTIISALKEYQIQLSMDGKDRATDNALVERFLRTLKQAYIYIIPR